MSALAIEARRVCVRSGSATLIDDIDLDVRSGELVGIVGPNGAGKSTLLAALAGDRRLAHGSVRLHGRDLRGTPIAVLAGLRAVLPQRSQLSLAFTAREVVQLAGHAIDRGLAEQRLAEVDLLGFADRLYPSLSGGEQQRVQLARVLAQLALSPRAVLLLDEPTSALDARHQHLVFSLARKAARSDHAVVAVVHDLTLAARWCDRIVLLAGGRIVADGSPDAVLTAPTLHAAYHASFEILRGAAGGLVVVSTGV